MLQGFHCCLKFRPLENRMGFSGGTRLTLLHFRPDTALTSSLTSHKEAEKAHLASQGARRDFSDHVRLSPFIHPWW